MQKYTNDELDKRLKAIGKGIFVKYFEDFKSGKDDVLSEENFEVHSKQTRISKARSIFNTSQEYEALENIVCSEKVDEVYRKKAKQILMAKNNTHQ